MTTATISRPKTYTPDEFLNLPNGKMYELVDGKLVRRRVGQESSWVETIIISILQNFVSQRRLGFLFSASIGMKIFPDHGRIPRPDVAFVRRERLPGGRPSGGFLETVPDLVVEVISLRDNASALERKLREYREVGIPLIWVVYPATRTVRIIRENEFETTLKVGDLLDGEPALPGFSCEVAEFFPE